jgi:hypothetical protein
MLRPPSFCIAGLADDRFGGGGQGGERVPFKNSVRLRGLLVLVDQPVQHLPASYPRGAQICYQWWKDVSLRWALSAALVRAMAVVMRQILAQHNE